MKQENGMQDQERLIVFPYTDGNKIAIEACVWIDVHVLEAEYLFSDEGVVVIYRSDGTDPPRTALVVQEEGHDA